jgi:D-amino peptidase
VCGVVDWAETELENKLSDYFKKQMSREVAAACDALGKSGVKEVLVKDAHGTGRSIDPSFLPKNTKILRSWPRNPYSMMGGIDGSFQGAGFIGYHSGAGSDGNPLSHTMNGNIFEVLINDIRASEFVLNAYSAASFGVPVYFLSGDRALCESAKAIAPNIKTAAITEGIGGGSVSIHPDLALERIGEMVKSALETDPSKMKLNLPDTFAVQVTFKKHDQAYRASFFPGAKKAGANQVKITCKNWIDVMTFIQFTF